MSQVPAPQHPRVEAERVPVLRAEEALRGDLQRVQRQPAGALRVRPGLLEHQIRPGRVQSPPAAALEAGAEHPCSSSGGGMQGLREPERRGPDGLIPGAASSSVADRLLPDQSLDGEALLVIAVLEHCGEGEGEDVSRSGPVGPVRSCPQMRSFPRRPITLHNSPPVRKRRAHSLTAAPGGG